MSNVKKAYKYLLNFNIETYLVDVIGQIWFQVNFDLTKVDSQFPLFPSPDSWIIRARRQEIKNQPFLEPWPKEVG